MLLLLSEHWVISTRACSHTSCTGLLLVAVHDGSCEVKPPAGSPGPDTQPHASSITAWPPSLQRPWVALLSALLRVVLPPGGVHVHACVAHCIAVLFVFVLTIRLL